MGIRGCLPNYAAVCGHQLDIEGACAAYDSEARPDGTALIPSAVVRWNEEVAVWRKAEAGGGIPEYRQTHDAYLWLVVVKITAEFVLIPPLANPAAKYDV